MEFEFDGLGEEAIVTGGGKVKNEKIPAAGEHAAVIRSIVGMGNIESFFNGESKGVNARICVVFELKEEDDFETDGETPLTITKDIDVKKGEKGNIALLCNAFKCRDKSKPTSFTKLIGSVGTVTVAHDKTGKYANCVAFNKGGVAPYPAKFINTVEEAQGGVGFVPFEKMTVEAMEELHAWNHVADGIMQATNYEGSRAQEVVAEIRAMEGRENYADKTAAKTEKQPAAKPAANVPDMDENEEF